MVVAAQLPNDNPVKQSALEYVTKYEAATARAVSAPSAATPGMPACCCNSAIPVALKKAKPGTVEFRRALREALENTKNVAGAHGIFNLTPNDHQGFDQRARVMVTIENNTWKLLK
jgi:branched-chain amino acid transport system substrate-binding protein